MKSGYLKYAIDKLLNGEAVDERQLTKHYKVKISHVVQQLLKQTAIEFTTCEYKNTTYIIPDMRILKDERKVEEGQISFQEQFLKDNLYKHEIKNPKF